MVPGSRSLVRTRWEPGDPRQVELRGRAVEEGHARLGWAAPQGGLRAGHTHKGPELQGVPPGLWGVTWLAKCGDCKVSAGPGASKGH